MQCYGRNLSYRTKFYLVWIEVERRIRKGLIKEMTFEIGEKILKKGEKRQRNRP